MSITLFRSKYAVYAVSKPTLSQFTLDPRQQQPDVSENPWRTSFGRGAAAVVSPAPTTSFTPGSHAQRHPAMTF